MILWFHHKIFHFLYGCREAQEQVRNLEHLHKLGQLEFNKANLKYFTHHGIYLVICYLLILLSMQGFHIKAISMIELAKIK